jgi:hypothetical protein
MNQFLNDLLLLKTANIDEVYKVVKSIAFPVLSVSFILGAVYENLSTQNFVGLFKRLIIALFLISFGASMLKSTINMSFDISGRILTSVRSTNPIVQLIERARSLSQKAKTQKDENGLIEKAKTTAKGIWESQAFVSKLFFDDGISSIVFIFSYAALMFLGQLYTIAYNFSYVSIPLLASLIVFPPTYSVANSITRTISWVFLMPIFTTITILLLSNSFSFPQDGSNIYYFMSLENLLNFCIMAIMLLFVPTILSGFLSGSGVLTAAETFTKTTVTAALSGGKSLALASASKVIFGKNFGLATLGKVGLSKGLDRLGSKSIEARSRLASTSPKTSTSSPIQGESRLNESSLKTMVSPDLYESKQDNSTRSSIISRSFDRSVVAADSVFNFKKNYIASKAVKSSHSGLSFSAAPDEQKTQFFKYKLDAHRSSRPMRPVDHKISKIRNPQNSNTKYTPRKMNRLKDHKGINP